MMPIGAPPIILNAAPLFKNYDVLFCDIWGVVHNGMSAYSEGCAALARFRENGGKVILVSNAPRTAQTVRIILDSKSVPRDIADAIVTSGDLARQFACTQSLKRVYHIGPDRDLDIFDSSDLECVSLSKAEAIFCTGLVRDWEETGEDYRPKLLSAAQRQLTMICANPDLVVDVGGTLLPCAGAIAKVYEDLGGPVFWAGKPFAPAYNHAMRVASKLHGGAVDKAHILAIGDAVRTDIAGAVHFGIDSLFIAQGIHREAIMSNGELSAKLLAELFAGEEQIQANAAMSTLCW